MPQTVPSGAATFQFRYAGGSLSPPMYVDVKSVAPETFFIQIFPGEYLYQQAAAFHAGTRILADESHPAAVGEKLEIYGLGWLPPSKRRTCKSDSLTRPSRLPVLRPDWLESIRSTRLFQRASHRACKVYPGSGLKPPETGRSQ